MHRWVNRHFNNRSRCTIGADFYTRDLTVADHLIGLQIWDTLGQERFQGLGQAFFRGTDVCILAFTQGDEKAWRGVEIWRRTFEDITKLNNSSFGGFAGFIVVETKNDLPATHEQIQSVRTKALQYCEEHEFPFVSTSSKANLGVDDVFTCAAEMGLRGHFLTYRKRRVRQAIKALWILWEAQGRCFAGVPISRDVLGLVCAALKLTMAEPCWGVPALPCNPEEPPNKLSIPDVGLRAIISSALAGLFYLGTRTLMKIW